MASRDAGLDLFWFSVPTEDTHVSKEQKLQRLMDTLAAGKRSFRLDGRLHYVCEECFGRGLVVKQESETLPFDAETHSLYQAAECEACVGVGYLLAVKLKRARHSRNLHP